ncbi:MAG: phosphate-starvation-inducible PsiE family protein [Gammaproteobacteria bacterium]|nr:phosphate-starvation-inducible PsiE family protein [Gammaproteobacteria bacterium]
MDNIFEKAGRYIAIALLVLMGIVVIAATVELAYEIVMGLIQPPGFFLDVTELLETFGLFLMVLIGLELMTSIHMYLSDHTIHAEMMFLVAMTAVTRKIVILETTTTEPLLLFGLGFLIFGLSGGYFLMRKSDRRSARV